MPPKTRMQRRGFCGTLNNWSEEEYEAFMRYTCDTKYFVIQTEIGKEKGTPHLQAYMYFDIAKDCATGADKAKIAKECFGSPRWSIRIAMGTPQQNLDYCNKSDTWTGEHRETNIVKRGKPQKKQTTQEYLDIMWPDSPLIEFMKKISYGPLEMNTDGSEK